MSGKSMTLEDIKKRLDEIPLWGSLIEVRGIVQELVNYLIEAKGEGHGKHSA